MPKRRRERELATDEEEDDEEKEEEDDDGSDELVKRLMQTRHETRAKAAPQKRCGRAKARY
jgi:hypothetical protein